MADVAVAYRQLAPAARRDVTVVFVTEDPRRDTPDLLRRWLDGFDPRFVGLMGGGQRTRTVLQQLYAPVSRINPDPSPASSIPPVTTTATRPTARTPRARVATASMTAKEAGANSATITASTTPGRCTCSDRAARPCSTPAGRPPATTPPT